MIALLIAWFGLYPLFGTVTEINVDTDVVTFECSNGNVFEFGGADDWMVGDGVACIMTDNGTDEVDDDEILKVRYVQ